MILIKIHHMCHAVGLISFRVELFIDAQGRLSIVVSEACVKSRYIYLDGRCAV